MMTEPFLCRTCHHPMVRRPLDRQTPEQRWCGLWYDCKQNEGTCGSTWLVQSPELLAHLAEQEARLALADASTPKRRRPRSGSVQQEQQ